MKLGLVGRVLGSLVLLASLSGCEYLVKPADGWYNRGGALNLCSEECERNASWRRSVEGFSTDELLWVHYINANGSWLDSFY